MVVDRLEGKENDRRDECPSRRLVKELNASELQSISTSGGAVAASPRGSKACRWPRPRLKGTKRATDWNVLAEEPARRDRPRAFAVLAAPWPALGISLH